MKTNIKNYRLLSIINTNYKFFIDIFIQRLIKILKKIIISQQIEFLFERLIDNNIKTIQYLIARYKFDIKKTKKKITLLFLN